MNKNSNTNTSIKTLDENDDLSLKSERLGCEIEEYCVNEDLTETHPTNEESKMVAVSNEDSLNKLRTIQTNNYKYIGEVNENNEKHGFGICEYTNGGRYVGQFVNDKRDGIGKLISKNGETYQGEFKNDVIDGFMETILKNVRKQGYAKGFEFEGEIILFNDENDVSVYSSSSNKIGLGTVLNPNKNYTFQGELDKSTQNGFGISYVKDKYVFKGQHNKQGFHGYGEVYRPDGSRFFGSYNNNCKSGMGISFNKEGKVALGKFVDDIKHGPFLHYFKNVTRVEMFNYGFKYKTIDKLESAKNYFKVYYPEFDWIFKINIKAISDLFSDVKTDEFLVQEKNLPTEEIKSVSKDQPVSKEVKENESNEVDKGSEVDVNINSNEKAEKSVKKENFNDLAEILN
jgi:hypothetical protein